MPVITYPQGPYLDDFDETKNFYQVTFGPAKVPQVREFNQLQTILRNQIDKLTSHFFKDGSPVVGGNVSFDNDYHYVRLQSTFNHNDIDFEANNYIDELVGSTITGQTTGVVARVLNYVLPEDSDSLTIFVRYESSGTDNETKTFSPEEICLSDGSTPRFVKISADGDISATGIGSAFSVDEGYWYVNGTLVFAPSQTMILSKYTNTNINTKLIYEISELQTTVAMDESLASNTLGIRNSKGNGAHRVTITLTLKQQPLEFDNRTINKFISLLTIRDSQVVKSATTEYSELGRTLAQRTFEESGNYTVRPFGIDVKEHLNDGSNLGQYSAAQGGDDTKLAVGLEKSVAYVSGYRIEVEDTAYVDVDKARDSTVRNAAAIPVRVGNYVLVDNISGLPDIDSYTTLNLLNSSSAIIGTARARSLDYVSGTKGNSAALYSLYLFEIDMNSGQSFANVDSISQVVPSGPQFTCDLTDSVLREANNNNLLFDLPYSTVRTLRSVGNQVDTLYDTKSTYKNYPVASGSVTINAGTNSVFDSTNSTDWQAIDSTSGSHINITGAINISSATSATIDFGSLGISDGTNVSIIAPINKNIQERSKTFIENHTYIITAPNTTNGNFDLIGNADILTLKSVHMSSSLGATPTTSDLDITDRYILDNGQRDNFYGTGRIQLKQGEDSPTGQLLVTYDYFQHGSGDYFSIDSYESIDYEDIPSYKGKSLRDVIDFRPTKSIDNAGFTGTGSGQVDMIKSVSTIRADIQYYLPRIDKIYVNKDGKFGVVKGVSAEPPAIPEDPKDSMVLYSLYINPYTFSADDVQPSLVDNKRYTMRDIGKIDRRLSDVEYFTYLSMLEQETANKQLYDPSGNIRFKNGFVADGFYGHNVANTAHPDYSAAIDKASGILRPSFYEDSVKLLFNQELSSSLSKTGSLITLDYDEVQEVSQPFASESEFVNPYAVFSWRGGIQLSPSSDEWKETKIAPSVIINNEGFLDTLVNNLNESGVIGTFWNEWQTNWTGVEVASSRTITGRRIDTETITTTTNSQSREGIERRMSIDTITENIGDRVVEVNFIPFMRSRIIHFKASRLKPNTKVYPFFENQDVSAYCRSETFDEESTFFEYADNTDREVINYLNASAHPDGATNLITDASGNLEGSFLVPNTPTVRFKTGARLFKLTDSTTNNRNDETTFAEVVYEAKGIIETKENVIISTQVPRVERSNLVDTRVIVDRDVQQETTWFDPLAQSFLLSNDMFFTSIDLYFHVKDDNLPVILQIRTMENGIPTQKVVPFSEVVMEANDILISADASVKTKFTFKSPVFLRKNVEYCFVVLSNSDVYKLWVATLGENQISNASKRIDKQPYAGSMFKSQNSSTWTPEQNRDIKFDFNRAQFNQTGTAYFNNDSLPLRSLGNDPLEFTSGSNVIKIYHDNHGMFNGSDVLLKNVEATSSSVVNGIPLSEINKQHQIHSVEFDSYKITVTSNADANGKAGGSSILASENNLINTFRTQLEQIVLDSTSIFHSVRMITGESVAGINEQAYQTDSVYRNIIPNQNVDLDNVYCIASKYNEDTLSSSDKKSFMLRSIFSGDGDYLSPVIDLDRLSLITVSNRVDRPAAIASDGINAVDNFISETTGIGGSVLSKYITKKMEVNEDAESLDIFLNVNRPSGSYVTVYYKVSTSDDIDFDNLDWIEAVPDIQIPFAENASSFTEIPFSIDEDDIGQTFTSFALKIVFTSSNSSKVVSCKDLRMIAGT